MHSILTGKDKIGWTSWDVRCRQGDEKENRGPWGPVDEKRAGAKVRSSLLRILPPTKDIWAAFHLFFRYGVWWLGQGKVTHKNRFVSFITTVSSRDSLTLPDCS